MGYEIIGHYEAGPSGTTVIEFSNIPQDGTDLMLYISVRSDAGGTYQSASVTANTYGSGTYQRIALEGNGSSTSGQYITNDAEIYVGPLNAGGSSSGVFSSGKIYIADYTGVENKIFVTDMVSESAAQLAYQQFTAYTWSLADAITSLSVQVYGRTNTLVQYSSATLYKITKGSDGITTVS
jgi:hypothetical protein